MMRMRALAAVALLAAGCMPMAATPTRRVPLGESFRLDRGETAAVEDLSLRFVTVVEDSRCPVGVQCIRAGEGRVQLALRAGRETDAVIVATEGGQPRYASFGPYDIHLVTLDPPRRRDEPHPQYVATLRVTRH